MSLKKWEVIDAVFIIFLGTLLHFTYDWSGQNVLVGTFSAVNESTWEHLKLLFFPALLFSIFEYFFVGKEYPCFFTVKLAAILLGMAGIVTAFYTYTGIVGTNFLAADILCFVFGALIVCFISYYGLSRSWFCSASDTWRPGYSLAALLLLAALFIFFTFYPPGIGLFADPSIQSGH